MVYMKSSLFWNFTQCRLVLCYRRLGTTAGPILKRAWIDSAETSVANYQSRLRKIAEQRRSRVTINWKFPVQILHVECSMECGGGSSCFPIQFKGNRPTNLWKTTKTSNTTTTGTQTRFKPRTVSLKSECDPLPPRQTDKYKRNYDACTA